MRKLMKSEHLEIFKSLRDFKLLAICIWGEARGEPIEGKIAVGNVVRNRVNANTWYGKDYKEVILKAKQFSCFNADDPNFEKCLYWAKNPADHDTALLECKWVAIGIIYDYLLDNTIGATHYHQVGHNPWWREGMKETVRIGNHIFYKERYR